MNAHTRKKLERQAAIAKKYGYSSFENFLRTEYAKHRKVAPIAKLCGVDDTCAWNYLKEHNIKLLPRSNNYLHISNAQVESAVKKYRQTHTYDQIGKMLGVSEFMVAQVMKGDRRDPSERPAQTKEGNTCRLCKNDKGANRWYCQTCHETLTDTCENGGHYDNALCCI